jgi:hypothetical protein
VRVVVAAESGVEDEEFGNEYVDAVFGDIK